MLDYEPGGDVIHRADVRAKLFIFLLVTVLLFLFKSPFFNLGFASFATLLMVFTRFPFRTLCKLLQPLVPALLLIVLFSGFSYGATSHGGESAGRVLFYGWPGGMLPFTYGGMLYGFTLLLRIYTMVTLTSVLTFTTPLDDFVQFMRVMKMPRPVTFMIVTAVRFVPTMRKKADRVFDAQRSRGAKLSGSGLLGNVFAYLPIMVPLIVDSLRMSENLAMAMLNRGYGATRYWTPLKKLHTTVIDFLVCMIAAAVFACFLYLSWRGYGEI